MCLPVCVSLFPCASCDFDLALCFSVHLLVFSHSGYLFVCLLAYNLSNFISTFIILDELLFICGRYQEKICVGVELSIIKKELGLCNHNQNILCKILFSRKRLRKTLFNIHKYNRKKQIDTGFY